MRTEIELVTILRDEWLKVERVNHKTTWLFFGFMGTFISGFCQAIRHMMFLKIITEEESDLLRDAMLRYRFKDKFAEGLIDEEHYDPDGFWFTLPTVDYEKAYNDRLEFLNRIIKVFK